MMLITVLSSLLPSVMQRQSDTVFVLSVPVSWCTSSLLIFLSLVSWIVLIIKCRPSSFVLDSVRCRLPIVTDFSILFELSDKCIMHDYSMMHDA